MSQLQILTLSNYLINYYFNGKRGIYVIEEVPSNRTLERQGRKAGPIFGLEEKYNINLIKGHYLIIINQKLGKEHNY